MLAIPMIALLGGIEYLSYWTVPPLPIKLSGDPILAYDSEIGFVPRPNSSTARTEAVGLTYNVHTDRRGARVSRPGEQTPEKVHILFIGDSFTWGHGVESEDTYAAIIPKMLGLNGANIALGSYGTTQALQMLHRNIDLRPRLVVYPFIADHLRRNVSGCSPTYYPFCLDASFVSGGAIKSPRTNGVRRTYLHFQYEQTGLDPLTWIAHGADVILGRVLTRFAQATASDEIAQAAALRYLLTEMKATTQNIGARLLVIFIPTLNGAAPQALRDTGVAFVDLTEPMRARAELYLPDGHPNAAGHRFIAEQITSCVSRELRPTQPACSQ